MIKKLLIATAGLLIAAPVLADGGHRHERHYKQHYKQQYKHQYQWKRHHRPVVVMPPPRVFYAPPPRVFYAPPAPVYYAPPPRPVYHGPESGISIRLHFPL